MNSRAYYQCPAQIERGKSKPMAGWITMIHILEGFSEPHTIAENFLWWHSGNEDDIKP